MKVIILLGLRVRSGTNFVGTTLKQHPDIQTIPPNTSLGEFNLFRDEYITNKVFYNISKRSFASGVKQEDLPHFMKLYGELWQEFLLNKFKLDPKKTLFLKSPRVQETHLWQLAFPNSKIVLLCRDGRDNVISSIKASNDKRNWHTISDKIKKKVNYFSGRNFINSTRDWSRNAIIYNSILETDNLRKMKYESLNDSFEGIKGLLNFYNLDNNEAVVKKCLSAPVIGSSYGINNKEMIKPNWKPDYDKSKFNFVGKWQGWNSYQKLVFKVIAGRELKGLGYEVNDDW
ncbi:sulfotransferase family protein [Mesonia algae]|uniref:Sulfotransferase family protein n=1 Tax=Mesonia algae TaxID=213248 RepID=A0A2W7I0V2_9FLAO|nr:sulfotransferase [Mesonia algae]PZW39072.1 sulfotransferase family protein [Mesonia algae]